MVLATHVLDWSDNDSDDSLLNGVYIEFEPSAPDPMQRYTVRLFAKDAHEWTLEHKGAASGGEIEEVENKPGILFSDKSDDDFETLSLFDSDSLSTAYPIASISSAITPTGLIDDLFAFVVSPGGSMSSQLSVIDNQLQLVADGKHYGQIEIDYTTTPYKEWTCKGATRGLQYYRASILKDNVFREKYIAVDIGNTQGLEDAEDTGIENGTEYFYKVETIPTQPESGQDFEIRVYSSDAANWSLEVLAESGAFNGTPTFDPGQVVIIGQAQNETVSGSVSTAYPVKDVGYIHTTTGMVDLSEFKTIIPATANFILGWNNYLKLENNQLVSKQAEADAQLSGELVIDYQTTAYKKWNIQRIDTGTVHYKLTNSVSGKTEQFSVSATTTGTAQQTLQVRDYCTDEPIPNANITIDGVAYTADANGYVVLGEMTTGQTLPMTITATGYHDTDVDTLNNDELNT